MVQVVVAHLKVILNLGLPKIVVQEMDVLHHVVLIVQDHVKDQVLVNVVDVVPDVDLVVVVVPVVARDALNRAVMEHVLHYVQMVAVIVVVNLVVGHVQDLVLKRITEKNERNDKKWLIVDVEHPHAQQHAELIVAAQIVHLHSRK